MAARGSSNPNLPESVMLTAWAGLRNNVGKERLGPQDLEVAENIDLDDAGQPRRRRGRTLKLAGDVHSMWNAKHEVLAVKDGVLGIVNEDYTFVALQGGMGSTRVAYEQIDNTVYFVSLTASGKIDMPSRVVSAWGASTSATTWLSPVVNPVAGQLEQIRGKMLKAPPLAEYLTYHNGRLYMAALKTVWATELYMYDYVDKTRNYIQFEGQITGMLGLPGGIYVGTDEAVYWLSGGFGAMQRKTVVHTPMVPGSMIRVPASDVKQSLQQSNASGDAAMFVGDDGIFVGFDGGACYNLTDDKFEFPGSVRVAPMLRQQDGMVQYVAAMDSGGDPTNKARIGDYVDAEIVRA